MCGSPKILAPQELQDAMPKALELVQAHFTSQCLEAVLKLGVPNIIGDARLSVPEIVAEIKNTTPAHPNADALLRCMRALAATGVFEEACRQDGELEFGLTGMGALLQMGIAQPCVGSGLHHFVERPMWKAWSALPDFVAGKIQEPPFESVHQMGLFDYHAKVNQSSSPFQAFMDALTASELPAVVEGPDWSSMSGKTIVDVGGGSGWAMSVIADNHPGLKCVSMDLPHVVEAVRETEGPNEILRAGDMFAEGAIPQADAILLKHVLHNWDDAKAERILRNCSAALNTGGRIFVGEAVVLELGKAGEAVPLEWKVGEVAPAEAARAQRTPFLFDVLKMLSGGRERTRREWEHLVAASGLELEEVKETDCVTCQILILRKA